MKFWSSEAARATQAKMTRMANGLEKEVMNTPQVLSLLSQDERDAIATTIKTLRELKDKAAKQKEVHARRENEKKRFVENMNAAIKRAINKSGLLKPAFYMDRQRIHLLMTVAAICEERAYHICSSEDLMLEAEVECTEERRAEIRRIRYERLYEHFEAGLEKAIRYKSLRYNVDTDSYSEIMPPAQALQEIMGSITPQVEAKLDARYGKYIEAIEAYNRAVTAKKLRSTFKSV
ncbi:hypothetical protein JCM19237_285 [Photobacterium aphoticum]|uniref:Uncharacterized protein n=1 Tax=Photobacterium aphoticum TaxID=754436 RepID=A0A090QXH2_9GAMM|nr:hypothetical protein JCM19237_285 [Photobacterium aphoticum]